MVRKYGHGWFREPVRHGLAARGISTNKYFASRKQWVHSLILQGRLEEARKLQQEIEEKPGVAEKDPDPESSKSQFRTKLMSQGVEKVMEDLRYLKLSDEEKVELKQRLTDLTEIEEKMVDEEFRTERDELKQRVRDIKNEIEEADDESVQEELEEELERFEQQLAPMVGLGRRRDEILDDVNELRGIGRRKEQIPGFLTTKQLEKRLGQKRLKTIADVDQLTSNELSVTFRKSFKDQFPAARISSNGKELIVQASREEVVEKIPEGLNVIRDVPLSEDDMRKFLRRLILQKTVAGEKPMKLGFPKEIITEGREDISGKPGLISQVVKLQESTKRIDAVNPQTEMATAPDFGKVSRFKLNRNKQVKVPKETVLPRQDVSEITSKREEKRVAAAERRAKNLVAGEAMQTRAPGKVLAEDAKAKVKDQKAQLKEWKEILGKDFDEGDFE